MTANDKEIVEYILEQLRVNSVDILNLMEEYSLTGDESIEINGARRIVVSTLCNAIAQNIITSKTGASETLGISQNKFTTALETVNNDITGYTKDKNVIKYPFVYLGFFEDLDRLLMKIDSMYKPTDEGYYRFDYLFANHKLDIYYNPAGIIQKITGTMTIDDNGDIIPGEFDLRGGDHELYRSYYNHTWSKWEETNTNDKSCIFALDKEFGTVENSKLGNGDIKQLFNKRISNGDYIKKNIFPLTVSESVIMGNGDSLNDWSEDVTHAPDLIPYTNTFFHGIVEDAEILSLGTATLGEVFFVRSKRMFALRVLSNNTYKYYNEWPGRIKYQANDLIPYQTKFYIYNRILYFFDGRNLLNINSLIDIGTSDQRPLLSSQDRAYQYFDEDIQKLIIWNGSRWITATGDPVQEVKTLKVNPGNVTLPASGEGKEEVMVVTNADKWEVNKNEK